MKGDIMAVRTFLLSLVFIIATGRPSASFADSLTVTPDTLYFLTLNDVNYGHDVTIGNNSTDTISIDDAYTNGLWFYDIMDTLDIWVTLPILIPPGDSSIMRVRPAVTTGFSELIVVDTFFVQTSIGIGSAIILLDESLVANILHDEPLLPPKRIVVHPGYPNPFNPQTVIRFELFQPGQVRAEIRDILGRYVATLVNGFLPAGDRRASWDGRNEAGRFVASGVYVVFVRTPYATASRKVVLIR